MNAFELLKADHEKVSGLFEQVEETSEEETGTRQRLFTQIKNELEIHTHIEETIFYPALKQAAETRELVLEAIEEHQEVKDLLAQISGMSADAEDWEDRVTDLKDAVEHHVEEEEGEMFDNAREVLSAEQLEELGERMAAEKERRKAAGAA